MTSERRRNGRRAPIVVLALVGVVNQDRGNPRLLQLQHERERERRLHRSCRVLVTEAIRQGSEVVEYDQRDPRSNAVLNALVPQSPSRPLQ